MQIELSEERQAQLNAYAERHGLDPAVALDEVLGDALEWDEQDLLESVEAIRKGYESVKAGRTRPASEFFKEFRTKHGF